MNALKSKISFFCFLSTLSFLFVFIGANCGGTSDPRDSNDNESTDSASDADGDTDADADSDTTNTGEGEICGNNIDDDGDGAIDCGDLECRDLPECASNTEICTDGIDNDFDGDVDCQDSECANQLFCQEDCDNGQDDDGDQAVDCADDSCKGIDPACGEVCGDGLDNDWDGLFDCDDEDCAGVDPPCGDGDTDPDGMICNYDGSGEHVCQCADGVDNEGDGRIDGDDIHCFGPFDDDEETYATGIPGDNKGSKSDTECPFDGNSGTGNDGYCCNPADPGQNVTPNGCDDRGCCEIDVNGNETGEHVYVREQCVFAPACGQDGTHNCPCDTPEQCDDGQYCVRDQNTGAGFCSTCEPCTPNEECENPCDCGEICYAGFTRPDWECGDDDDGDDAGPGGCPDGITSCPGGDIDCNPELNEICVSGCCYAQCEPGIVPCTTFADCPTDDDKNYQCITGCCIEFVGPI